MKKSNGHIETVSELTAAILEEIDRTNAIIDSRGEVRDADQIAINGYYRLLKELYELDKKLQKTVPY